MNNIFIIGSKGVPAQYGGFETFVDNLITQRQSNEIVYIVACMGKAIKQKQYNKARLLNINVPQIGSAKAVLYDLLALNNCIRIIKNEKLLNSTIYILACRIGPFMWLFNRRIRKLNIKVYINPDGHEWKRSKWNKWIKKYWKISEKFMIKHGHCIICDSKAIEKYINNEYQEYNPNTIFIPYGADVVEETQKQENEIWQEWFDKNNVEKQNYYLSVGRFVPENNYETMIREYITSTTKKDLVIITNNEENNFYKELRAKTQFHKDPRIKFVGTVYNQKLLAYIRCQAYAYIHGHEVGGTNPSLLEALACTKINILLDVCFNQEVAQNSAVYFSKEKGSLQGIINQVDILKQSEIEMFEHLAKTQIRQRYQWNDIVKQYEELFLCK